MWNAVWSCGSLFKENTGEDMWGEKRFSGEVVGVTAISEAGGEILC